MRRQPFCPICRCRARRNVRPVAACKPGLRRTRGFSRRAPDLPLRFRHEASTLSEHSGPRNTILSEAGPKRWQTQSEARGTPANGMAERPPGGPTQ